MADKYRPVDVAQGLALEAMATPDPWPDDHLDPEVRDGLADSRADEVQVVVDNDVAGASDDDCGLAIWLRNHCLDIFRELLELRAKVEARAARAGVVIIEATDESPTLRRYRDLPRAAAHLGVPLGELQRGRCRDAPFGDVVSDTWLNVVGVGVQVVDQDAPAVGVNAQLPLPLTGGR